MPLSPSTWDNVLSTILGAKNIDRKKVIEKPWLTHAGYWDEGTWLYSKPSDYRNIWDFREENRAHYYRYGLVSVSDSGPTAIPYIVRVAVDYYTNGSFNQHHAYIYDSMAAIYTWPIVNFDKLTFDEAYGVFWRAEEWLINNAKSLQDTIDTIDTDVAGFRGSAAEAFRVALRNIREVMERTYSDVATTADGTARRWSGLLEDNSLAIDTFTKNVLRKSADDYEHRRDASQYGKPDEIILSILTQVRNQNEGKMADEDWNVSVTYGGLTAAGDLRLAQTWVDFDKLAKDAWIKSIEHYLDAPMKAGVDTLEASYQRTQSEMSPNLIQPVPYVMSPQELDPDARRGPGIDPPGGGAGGGGLDIPGGGADLPGGGADLPGGGGGGGGLDIPGGGSDFGGSGFGDSGLTVPGGGSGLGGLGGGSGMPDLGAGGSVLPGIPDGSGLMPLLPMTPSIPGSPMRPPSGGGLIDVEDESDMLTGQLPTAIDVEDIGTIGVPKPMGGGGEIGLLGPTGAGGIQTAALSPAAGLPMGGMGGMGGMPFMPPMGGMGGMGQGQSKDRERTTWLAEEEELWGTDPDCMPAVVGRDDSGEYADGATTRTPVNPYGPTAPRPGTTTRTTRRGN